MIEGVIALAAATAATVFYGARRVRGVWRAHTSLDRIEALLREAREAADGPPRLRAAPDDDDEIRRVLAMPTHAVPGELTALGSLVLFAADRTRWVAATNALVDPAGTSCVLVTVNRVAPHGSVSVIYSFTPAGMAITASGHYLQLASPPFVRRQTVATTALATLLAAHRAFAGRDSITIATRDELVAAAARVHVDTAAWRATQPPEQLLEADVRAALGPKGQRRVAMFVRRLRGPIPAARVV